MGKLNCSLSIESSRLVMDQKLVTPLSFTEEFMQKKPNKVTMKAMKQSETGKGLKKFKNLDEMLEDLGI